MIWLETQTNTRIYKDYMRVAFKKSIVFEDYKNSMTSQISVFFIVEWANSSFADGFKIKFLFFFLMNKLYVQMLNWKHEQILS